jgi:NADH-quinone oxidoreductase subunit L
MHQVEHELHHRGIDTKLDPQDMRTMGNLRKFMPSTHATYLLATLAIAGIPLFSGFFSKDEILFKAFEYGYDGHAYAWAVWGVGVATALLTAVYMIRSYILTFRGEGRWPLASEVHPEESPASMTLPLWVLGILSVVGGFVGLPGVIAHGEWNQIHHFLGLPYGGPVAVPEMASHVPIGLEWGLILLGSFIAITGVALGWRWYVRSGLQFDEMLERRLGGLYRLFAGKYFVDEFYDRAIVRPLIDGVARGSARFDEKVIDGAVNGLGKFANSAGDLLRRIQTGVVQNYALALVLGVILIIVILLFGT